MINDLIKVLGIPGFIASALVALWIVAQFVGEIIELKGKIVPEFFKIRKYFKRKKDERRLIDETATTLAEVKTLLQDVNNHYSADNIAKRDAWMKKVNCESENHENDIANLRTQIDQVKELTLELFLEHKRNLILEFAAKVVDEKYPVTREQFNRIFKVHAEYEEMIEKYKLVNGEVDIAHRIINEAYSTRLKEHSFLEQLKGYDNN